MNLCLRDLESGGLMDLVVFLVSFILKTLRDLFV